MRRNPERVAWMVLLFAFATFVLIVVGVPLGVRWYIHDAVKERKALVESLSGTIVVEPPVGSGPVPLSKGQSMSVTPGTLVRADENAEVVITFFDHSFMRLFPGGSVRLDELSGPRYASGEQPNRIALTLLGGRLRVGTALALESALEFQISTLQATTQLAADGSYAVSASNDLSEVTNYRGQAKVRAGAQTVNLDSRQRTEVFLGRAPAAPTGIARNLLANSDFSQPLEQGWTAYNDQGTDGGNVDGEAAIVVEGGRRAVRFFRTGAQGNHCETIIEQTLNQTLPDPLTALTVRATVKVTSQGLSGGGYLSSEFPLMMRLTYRDSYDSENEWVQAFYYQNDAGNPTTYGLQIPQDRWYLFESENLVATLPVRPFKVIKLSVYASGWDYESMISEINLIVE